MTVTVTGTRQLEARLRAVEKVPAVLLRTVALRAVREQKRLVPRKTGNLGRSILLGRVTSTTAITQATANYAAAVEYGTRPHVIKPRKAKALRSPAAGSATTLGGRLKAGGSYAFAKVVHHPGTKAQPFMLPGAKKAISETVGADAIITAWNKGA